MLLYCETAIVPECALFLALLPQLLEASRSFSVTRGDFTASAAAVEEDTNPLSEEEEEEESFSPEE